LAFPKLGGLIHLQQRVDEGGKKGEIFKGKKICPFSTQTKEEIKWFRGRSLQAAEGNSVKFIYFHMPAEKASLPSIHMHENSSPGTWFGMCLMSERERAMGKN
jgi:hypothetical protein